PGDRGPRAPGTRGARALPRRPDLAARISHVPRAHGRRAAFADDRRLALARPPPLPPARLRPPFDHAAAALCRRARPFPRGARTDRLAVPPFVHQHASHCESGVMGSLVRHRGLPMSEAMAFGLASAILFAYLPFIRVHGLPIIAYRSPPRGIIRRLDRDLGLGMRFERFRSPAEGTRRLNELLDQGSLVGLQTSAFWLPYFPPDMRFHFNAHNLIIYGREAGREGDEYLVSDPVAETVVRIARADLEKARFARGILAPKGLLYYATMAPAAPDYPRLGKRALVRAVNAM